MTRSRKRRAARRARASADKNRAASEQATAAGPVEAYKPKPGPGQVLIREFVDAKSGHEKHYRNIAVTPLMCCYYKHKLDSIGSDPITALDRYEVGQQFEQHWFVIHRTGGSALVEGVGGYAGLFWTEAKQLASERLARIKQRMHAPHYAVIENFCGYGYEPAEALRLAGIVVPSIAVLYRIREALDELVYAVTGRSRSDAAHVEPHTIAVSGNSRRAMAYAT